MFTLPGQVQLLDDDLAEILLGDDVRGVRGGNARA